MWPVVLAIMLLGTPSLAEPQFAPEELRKFIEMNTNDSSGQNSLGLYRWDDVGRFYGKREYHGAWGIDSGGLAMAEFLAEISLVSRFGLAPGDYHWEVLQNHPPKNQGNGSQMKKYAMRRDILLTDAFMRLVQDIVNGHVAAAEAHRQNTMPREDLDGPALLEKALSGAGPAVVLDSLHPQWPGYAALLAVSGIYRDLLGTPWEELRLEDERFIPPDSHHPLNFPICHRLILLGDLAGEAVCKEVDTSNLRTAIRRFQARHGLIADGIIGPQTLTELNVNPEQRLRQIEVNLERWRWLPREAANLRIEVNIPGFFLRVYERGNIPVEMKVVVGREAWHTKSFLDTLTYLEFNPEWYVPTSIAVATILPQVKAQVSDRRGDTLISADSIAAYARQYFSQKNYILQEQRENIWTNLDPAQVDWSLLDENNFPFRIRQLPGPENAMGRVKFLFPNPYAIYLHDTPSQDHFRQNVRMASHGCIRVEKPLELAEFLLGYQNWDKAEIERILDEKKTRRVTLERPVPIFITYFTAWSDSVETVHFRRDIYDWDERLLSAGSMLGN